MLHSDCNCCQAVLLVFCHLAGALAAAIPALTCLQQVGFCAGAPPSRRSGS